MSNTDSKSKDAEDDTNEGISPGSSSMATDINDELDSKQHTTNTSTSNSRNVDQSSEGRDLVETDIGATADELSKDLPCDENFPISCGKQTDRGEIQNVSQIDEYELAEKDIKALKNKHRSRGAARAVAGDKMMKVLDPQAQKNFEWLMYELLKNPEKAIKYLYQAQSLHEPTCLGKEVRSIAVHISRNISRQWKKNFEISTALINRAAPGLKLWVVDKDYQAEIKIDTTDKTDAETSSNIWETDQETIIFIPKDSETYLKKRADLTKNTICTDKIMVGISTHEFFHALGFGHEHQSKWNTSEFGDSNSVPGKFYPVAWSDDDDFRPRFTLYQRNKD